MNFVSVAVLNLPSTFLIVWPFVVVVAGFVVFLIMNGGIVVGKRRYIASSFSLLPVCELSTNLA